MAANSSSVKNDSSDSSRLLAAIVVIMATTVAGGVWSGMDPTRPGVDSVNVWGYLAGFFLGLALASTAWLASSRSSS